ncbi:PadR family transcriptional regulator [Kocuria dechangensis]|uniref:PadR family transcriptional regulator n=1 Tax=Kocuria dechangensis TaxID=1176249 RepID=A0A917GN06_9MICC|nr:PadR family transcriptional regulator [Kocuria dechangensis]GGG52169.1 PadR family transcriptional regulator [Kocuria dechangensis]
MEADLEDRDAAPHLQQLRRGTVVLACLLVLDEPRYGYALLRTLGDAGLDVEANTLYPLLRRLETQGLLESDWNTEESRPRKFYRITPRGVRVRDVLEAERLRLHATLSALPRPPRHTED